jgi:hypothetical protein
MRLACRAALPLVLFLAGTGAALAESPVGFWTDRVFLEPALSLGATQKVCFKADHTWYSTTASSFRGGWFNEGDSLRWYGPGGFTAIANADRFITKRLITGTFDEFRLSSGKTFNSGTSVLTFTSATCPPPPTSADAAEAFSK